MESRSLASWRQTGPSRACAGFFETLALYPRVGVYRSERDVYEAVNPRTPFVAFYRIDTMADMLIVVAFFHHAQDRESQWGKRSTTRVL